MAQRSGQASWIEKYSRWQIKVQKDGERRTFTSKTPGTKGKAEAERKADKWLESGEASGSVRFQKLWDDFLKETKLLTSTGNYAQKEQMGRLWLLPKLKAKRVSSITQQSWQDCINAAYKKGKSKKTLKNIRGAITAFCKYAKKQKIIIERPEDVVIPADAPIGKRKILQPDALKILFSVDYVTRYKTRQTCFYINAWRFMALTGLRRGEICGLKKADIKGNVVHIQRSINMYGEITKGKTDAADRYFVLSARAAAVLKAQQEMLKQQGIISDYVFPDENAKATDPAHLYKTWYKYRQQHGIECSLHEMRHTLISVAKADVPEQLLKRAVGHTENMDTFGVYGHDIEGEMQQVADILDSVFDKLLG